MRETNIQQTARTGRRPGPARKTTSKRALERWETDGGSVRPPPKRRRLEDANGELDFGLFASCERR